MLLSGGHANTNIRIGEKVLRIYRREPAAALRERALLGRSWTSFRVPAVLGAGGSVSERFLILEYIEHTPVLDTAAHGAAVGTALAEIHALTFERAGELDESLDVCEPYPDLVGALVTYARSQLEERASGLAPELGRRAIELLEVAAPRMREAAGPPVLLHADFKASNLHWANDRLLVLDWEFAYAGAALSDIGQLLRWSPSPAFVAGFAEAYRAAGGHLVADFQHMAALFDLVNLAGLAVNLADAGDDAFRTSTRIRDLERRIELTLAPRTCDNPP